MRYLFKEYLKDLKVILVFCLGFSCFLSAGVVLSGLLFGQMPDRDFKIGLIIFTGLFSFGGALSVTIDHAGKWNTIRSEHFAPPSIEPLDMKQLNQRIEEVQSHDKP
jgi:hypothetical protein